MLNLIIIYLIIHYILIILFKPKQTTLNCGLFAWASDSPKKYDKNEFNILGIFNDSRGGDSCGIAIDNTIKVGYERGEREYMQFIHKYKLPSPRKIPFVLGHTRRSSVGTINIHNTHPFGFGDLNGEYEFIGAHNGTIHNHEELAKKYNISLMHYKGENPLKKIDSEILLEILYKSRSFKVLSEYIGGAALIWSDRNEPNISYFFKGASSETKGSSSIKEERPLFYYRKSKNNLYVSSLKESLLSITNKEENIGEFENNTVYKITDGDIINAEKFKISRSRAYQKEYYNNYYNYNNYGTGTQDDLFDDYNNRAKSKNLLKPPYSKSKIKYKKDIKNSLIINENKFININKYKGNVYLRKLRYQRNGHNINGIYTWLPSIGLFYLGDTYKSATTRINSLKGCYFEGPHQITKKDNKGEIYFKENFSILTNPLFYFFDGVRVETNLDYEILRSYKEDNPSILNVENLSHCSTHPLVDEDNMNNIIFKGTLFTGIICPFLSENILEIEKGFCKKITTVRKYEKKKTPPLLISPLISLNDIDDIKLINEFIPEEDKEKNNDFVNIIHNHLLEPYNKIIEASSELSKYNNIIIDKVIKSIEGFSNELMEIIIEHDEH